MNPALLLCLLLSWRGAAWGTEPYRQLSTAGAQFNGPGRDTQAPDTLSAVRLGLIGPAQGPAGEALRQGALQAVNEANAAGGFKGLPFEIVFKPDDGPWGVVASQVVQLAQTDQVWAIVGGLDGERAHAAELVAAKLWVPVLSPGAGDLTIDYANVPWMFRCLPDDRSQADLLARLSVRQGWQRLAVASEATRDSRLGFQRLQEAARACSLNIALQVEYAPSDPTAVAQRLEEAGAQALVIWGRPATALDLLARLRRDGCALPVLGPAPLALPEVAAQGGNQGALIVAAPADLSAPGLQMFGDQPSYLALFAYDTTRLIIAALQQSGLNRARLRDELTRLPFAGLTGPFSFNSLGGRREGPTLMVARQGKWVRWGAE